MLDFTVSVTTTIHAPRAELWDVLLDVGGWSSWTTILTHVDGTVGVGSRPTLHLSPPQGRAYDFSPEVVAVEPGREFSWIGRTGVPGIFDGHHRFVLSDAGDGATDLLHAETYSGLLAPVLRRTVVRPEVVEDGFRVFNEDLARRIADA